MYSNIMKKYPQLNEMIEKIKTTRREEIIENLRVNDNFYKKMLKNRSVRSVSLVEKLSEEDYDEYERYMDLVYAQTVYELDTIYEVAFYDAISIFEKLNT